MISQAHFQTLIHARFLFLSAFANQYSEMKYYLLFHIVLWPGKGGKLPKIAQNLDQLHRLVRTQTLLHPSLYLEHLLY